MNNGQLYFAIGIPTFTVLCSSMIGIFQLNHTLSQIDSRFTSLEANIDTRFSLLESRMGVFGNDRKTLVKISNDLDVRLARLEERTAR